MTSNWMSYFSEKTLEMMGQLVYDFTQDDWAGAEKVWLEWFEERVNYFLKHLKPLEWLEFFPQLFLHNYERLFGELDPTNVAFTALPWTFVGPTPVFAQVFFMVFYNKMYAEGNVLLLGI